jgi:predicted nucleic acid-binding protein
LLVLILVSDTSILIDLERGGLLESVFSCGLTLIVPDLLYEKELEKENGPYLRALGLGVVALTPDELALAQTVKRQRPTLSLPDCFALCCAMRPACALVTGDKALRNEAKARGRKVYGLLWLLDQMAASNSVDNTLLYTGLSRIAAHPQCRLPADEVKARLNAWVRG